MPCSYRTYPGHNVIVKWYRGRVTTGCVLDLLDQVEEDPDYIEGMMELDDMRDVTEFAIPPEDIGRFADLIKSINGRRRQPSRKAVVSGVAAIRQAAEAYGREVEDMPDINIGIFDDLDAALEFLQLSATPLGHTLSSQVNAAE